MDFMKVCQNIGSIQPRAKVTAMETLAAQKVMNLKCFNCRKPGHMKKQCRLPIGPRQPPTTMNFKEKGKPPDLAHDAQKGNIA